MLAKFNPSFILELPATPNRAKEQQSNVLHSVTGLALKKEEMVKVPLNLHNAGQGDWKDTLIAAHGKLADIEHDETGRYVRPILLVRVERVGKDQTEAGKVHANDVRKFLHETLGAKEGEVAEKTSETDELSDHCAGGLDDEVDSAGEFHGKCDRRRGGGDRKRGLWRAPPPHSAAVSASTDQCGGGDEWNAGPYAAELGGDRRGEELCDANQRGSDDGDELATGVYLHVGDRGCEWSGSRETLLVSRGGGERDRAGAVERTGPPGPPGASALTTRYARR